MAGPENDRYQDATIQGVRDAWDFWLNQHPVSIPDLIQDAVRAGVSYYLDSFTPETWANIVSKAVEKATREWLEQAHPGEATVSNG